MARAPRPSPHIPRRGPAREKSAPGPQGPASVPRRDAPGNPRRAKFNFARAANAEGGVCLGPGRGAPDGIARLTCAAHSTDVLGNPGLEVSGRWQLAGRVCVPAPSRVPTSHPPRRAHGPGSERASAHALRCLPPRAAAQRAGCRAGHEEVPAGGPGAGPPRCPGGRSCA